MKTDKVISTLAEKPAGRLFRVRYVTPVKLYAVFDHAGVSILRVTDTTTRTGINYGNIKSVIAKEDVSDGSKSSARSWVHKNRIRYNSNTGKTYAVFYPIVAAKAHTTSSFIFIGEDGKTSIRTKEEIMDYIQPAYWKTEKSNMITVSIENILWVK